MITSEKKDVNKFYIKPSFSNFLLAFAVLLTAFILYKPSIFIKVSDRLMEVIFQDIGYGRYGKNINLNVIQSAIDDKLGVSGNQEMKTLRIDIKYKYWSEITNKRNDALKKNVLVTNSDDYVPMEINFEGKKIKAKARLKGDMVDHLQGVKWSFRVKIKGDNHIFGLKKFNIQHPQTRGYQRQLIIDDTYSNYGLITPKHLFVNVEINGEKLGIMLLEEHFSKELLERHKKKEGVIVKFDESLFWKTLELNNRDLRMHKPAMNPFHHYTNTSITTFSKKKVLENSSLREQYSLAVSMLRGFVEGDLKPSEIFDVELMGRYLAIADFFKAGHDSYYTNLRFYLNPLSLRLEPIPYDANVGYDINVKKQVLASEILKDPEIRKVFNRVQHTLNNDFSSDEYIHNLQAKEKVHLEQLKSEFYFLEGFDYSSLGFCSGLKDTNFPVYLHAYTIKKDDGYFLELRNATCEDIEVVSIEMENPVEGGVRYNKFITPFKLEKSYLGDVAIPVYIKLEKLEGRFSIIARRLSNGKQLLHKSINYPSAINKNPFPNNNIDTLLKKHDFFTLVGNTLNIKGGAINVNGNVVIPCGYKVVIDKGTVLQFDEDASWYSCGAVIIKGSRSEVVKFQPKEGVESWGGIAVYNAKSVSNWSNVVINRTKGVKFPYLSLTGGVTFYKSNVNIADSFFNNSFGEDALNIIHSKFKLNNVNMENTYSDAFDGDFVDGEIIGGRYSNIGYGGGGDAIDVSGSEILVSGTLINNVDDKGVSLGEGSVAQLTNITVRNSGMAVASKDGSIVNILNSTINNSNEISYASYMKKPVYGQATLNVKNNEYYKVLPRHKVQEGNVLTINGKKIEGVDIDVKSMYKR